MNDNKWREGMLSYVQLSKKSRNNVRANHRSCLYYYYRVIYIVIIIIVRQIQIDIK